MKNHHHHQPVRMFFRAALAAVFSALMAAAPTAPAVAAEPLVVNGFVTASNLPLWAGRELGYFRDAGVELTLVSPAGSIDQMRSLVSGRSPVVLTAVDNVMAYRRGQGNPEVGTIDDFVAVAGMDNGMLTLVAAPDVGSIQDLQGRTLAVDAIDTGFSYAFKAVLTQAGLDVSRNPMIAVGNTAGRYKALQDKRASAAVLTIPADIVAAANGYKVLGGIVDVLGPYQGNVVAVRSGWAEAHEPLLANFLKAYRRSLDWVFDPANKDAALAVLRREMPELTPEGTQAVFARLVDPQRGLFRTMTIDKAGLQRTLSLRERYGPPSSMMIDPASIVDGRYLDDASK